MATGGTQRPKIKWILKNEDAIRQAIINGFGQHLCNADSDIDSLADDLGGNPKRAMNCLNYGDS